MQLIAYNIKQYSGAEEGAGGLKKIRHAMLDWYEASSKDKLSALEVRDAQMRKSEDCECFYEYLVEELDLVVGSDLIYFEESIGPLLTMIHFMLTTVKRERGRQVEFLMCQILRSKALFD
mmetsp:Transcript_4152/g.7030  ORF Transcript_4152/g.7030 Transcript_4152/m.7030 type:complete len:120 (+) Transcript_4152:391-750(+)